MTVLRSQRQRGESDAGCVIGMIVIAVIGFALYDRYDKKKTAESAAVETAPANAADQEANEIEKLAVAKTWRLIALPNIDKNVHASLHTSWRSGKLFYRFVLEPKSSAIAQAMRSNPYGRKHFVVALQDQFQFAIVKIPVPLGTLTRIVDEEDNVLSYEANDSVECDRKSYEDLRDWTLQWSL